MEINLKKNFSDCLLRNVKLAELSAIKIGGVASYAAFPENLDALMHILDFCRAKGLNFFLFGNGSNTIFPDDIPKDIVFISLRKFNIRAEIAGGGKIYAGAGILLPSLSAFAKNNDIGEFEFLSGIPGTVGAGVKGNVSFKIQIEKDIASILSEVEVFDILTCKKYILRRDEIGFSYRNSSLKNNEIVVGALFKSRRLFNSDLKNEAGIKRRNVQPSGCSLGSVFKNPPCCEKSAGWLIDKAGLKGASVGGVEVSKRHANFFINRGSASYKDFIELFDYVRGKVADKFSVLLEPEIKFLNPVTFGG